MDSATSSTNFSFAFNHPKFSDRLLSIEITPDPFPNHNHSRDDQLVIKQQQKPGDEATSTTKDDSVVLQTKTVHVNSAILAVKSPFFYKLFSNGMAESEQRLATLRIHASEEVALMELLKFMYNNTLSPATPSCLLDILMAADKYNVTSCVQYCSQRLGRFPMSFNFAISCLDLPSSVFRLAILQQLTNSAKQFIVGQFRDIKKFEIQVLKLPLSGIEAILSSDDIQVLSEDFVYDLVLKWAKFHYPLLEERRDVLERRLRHLIRFSYMSSQKLSEVARGDNFSAGVASEIVLEALVSKTETPYIQRRLGVRAYMYQPVQVVELVLPYHHCVVYLDLKRKDCVRLSPAECISSELFHLGRHGFFLSAYCNMHRQNQHESQCFGLYLRMLEKGSVTVDYEFASWSNEEEDYKTRHRKRTHTLTGGKPVGFGNLFDTTWASFIASDSPYFNNGILHLRATVSIK